MTAAAIPPRRILDPHINDWLEPGEDPGNDAIRFIACNRWNMATRSWCAANGVPTEQLLATVPRDWWHSPRNTGRAT